MRDGRSVENVQIGNLAAIDAAICRYRCGSGVRHKAWRCPTGSGYGRSRSVWRHRRTAGRSAGPRRRFGRARCAARGVPVAAPSAASAFGVARPRYQSGPSGSLMIDWGSVACAIERGGDLAVDLRDRQMGIGRTDAAMHEERCRPAARRPDCRRSSGRSCRRGPRRSGARYCPAAWPANQACLIASSGHLGIVLAIGRLDELPCWPA